MGMIWIVLALMLAMLVLAFVGLRGQRSQAERERDRIERALLSTVGALAPKVDFAALGELPAPVRRYLRHVLVDNQAPVRSTRMQQRGTLRTSLRGARWIAFEADQLLVPGAPGFLWVAWLRMNALFRLRIMDAFAGGHGHGELRLYSAWRIAGGERCRELDEACLHRYLAEAVWSPTALLPAAGVEWSALDDRRAIASLACADARVSLEFRFNSADEVSAIYTPGRWMREGRQYRQQPWEGRFFDYRDTDGMRTPSRGEVGWIVDGVWQCVWKGEIVEITHER